jgi:glutamate-1-semialdehyde 2,1-aminomutase
VPSELASLTLTASFNYLAGTRALFDTFGGEIAAVIVEPVAGNMNCIPPEAGFLEGLRALCTSHGALLIFDEVMTGFRVHRNSAQGLYDVRPDLTVLGKIIGGGMPVGAFGGPAAIMNHIAPEGPVYQAGTLSGNPLAMSCGLATLELTDAEDFYTGLEHATRVLVEGFEAAARDAGVALSTNCVTGMFGLFFSSEDRITRYDQAMRCDGERFRRFYHAMLARGVYLAPSAFEAGFVSAAHSIDDIELTIEAARASFRAL